MEKENTPIEGKVTTLWEMYKNGLTYLQSTGLFTDIPHYHDYYEGRQWPDPTDETQDLPRPVVNLIKKIVDNKVAGVLSSRVKLNFISDNMAVQTEKFNNFAEYIQKEIRQEEADNKAVNNGAKSGGYAYHYYWDKEAKGKKGTIEGAVRVEVIDILNIIFSNPKETDEQKQKWIIIASREDVESVKANADDKNMQIGSDENETAYKTVEQEGTDYVTVLTRYFRKNGEVFVEKGYRGGIINAARPLTPDVEGELRKLKEKDGNKLPVQKIDVANDTTPDPANKIQNDTGGRKCETYPIVIGQWNDRNESIVGIGEIEGLIPNQDAINFSIALQLLNIQNQAWGKIITKDGALRDQEINNVPGQHLVDYSLSGEGIKRLQEAPMTGVPMNIIQGLMDMTRMATSASEVVTGDIMNGNMSGAAIAQWQSQALKPIEALKRRYWRVKEKQGRVLEQFFKFFYNRKEYSYEDKQPIENSLNGALKESIFKQDVFNGKEYQDTEFTIAIEAGAATSFSEAGDINMLESLLNKNMISLRTFITAYPKNATSIRKELLKAIEEDENGQIANMTKLMSEMEDAINKAQVVMQEQTKIIESIPTIVAKNYELSKKLADITAEYIKKIDAANKNIDMAEQVAAGAVNDARTFAEMIDNIAKEKSIAKTREEGPEQ